MDLWEQSGTVDPEVRAYVTSLVNAVGGSSTYDNTYSLGDDAVAVLKDLQRWLRLYDEKTNRLDVKRCLAEANLVKGDLLEILALWPEEATENKLKSKLALACLELLVPLTWPIALEAEKSTLNHHRHVPYLQLAQVGYKRAVLHYDYTQILRTVVRIGLPAMAVAQRGRSRRDEGIIKLVLYFFRNIAMIAQPQHLPSQGDENDVSRSSTIEQFHQQDVFTLLLTIGSGTSDEFQEQDVILLEILFHLLKGVDVGKLFMKKEDVAREETSELQHLMRKEKAMLDGYKKSAPTRHNRFGTMVWVKRDDAKLSTVSGQATITDEGSTLRQMDSSKKWNRPQYRGKPQEVSELSDFGIRVDLTENARKHLCAFVEDFLDSSFNPLFASLRKAIEREAERVQDTMHPKQYFYLIQWFLNAEAARRDRSRRDKLWHSDRPTQADVPDNMFAYIAAVLDQETFVLLNRRMQNAWDTKDWQDLQATLLCFTQILLTVQDMAESQDEEDQEIAENIQHRIFYEEATHDRIVQVLRGYTHQGFAYLDAVTGCVHVFVRMLERYSKQNVDLQIRSKRRARKKRMQERNLTEDGTDATAQQAPSDEEQEAHRTVSERKFDFARFSAKFLTQPCVNTYVSFMHYYRDLTPVQLKRCNRYLYRLAFKHELVTLLFRVDILQLLHQMIKGPAGLVPAMEGFKDWEQLVQQVFRRCIKWIDRETQGQGWREAAVVEMLFSKIPNTVFYLQNGYEKVVEKRPPRPPAELEVKSAVPEKERVAVAVSIMIDQAKADALVWVKNVLCKAVDERQSWEDAQTAQSSAVNDPNEESAASREDQASAPSIFITPDSDDRKSALFKDKHLRLLLTTLGFQRLGSSDDVDAAWIVPSEISAAQLKLMLEQVQQAEFSPPIFESDKRAEDLIRNKPTGRRGAVFDETDSEGDSQIDEAMFPPNLPEKRPQPSGSDDERPKKRRKRVRHGESVLTEEDLKARAQARKQKEKEKIAKIKSALFVTASDDESDAEADAEFFRLEAERRIVMERKIGEALRKERMHGRKAKGSKKRQAQEMDDEDEGIVLPPEILSDDSVSSSSSDDEGNHMYLTRQGEDMAELDDEEEEETPSTSPPPPHRVDAISAPLKELSGNITRRADDSRPGDAESEDDDEDMPTSKPPLARRRVRAGFLMDDSDDE